MFDLCVCMVYYRHISRGGKMQRKDFTIDEQTLSIALKKAKSLGLSLSAYIRLLINQDNKE